MHMHNHKFEKNSSPRSSVLSKSVGMLILFSRLEPTSAHATAKHSPLTQTHGMAGGSKHNAKAVPLEALKGATSKNESRWDNAYLGKLTLFCSFLFPRLERRQRFNSEG